jgi:hypothetical protein
VTRGRHAPKVALVSVSDATNAATTNPPHRCGSSWTGDRVDRVETLRSARSPLQHGLRTLLVRRRSGGTWCTVHFRSKDVRFAFGESSWSWSPNGNVADHRESWPRPRDFSHCTEPWPGRRGSCLRRWRTTAIGQLRLPSWGTLVAAGIHERFVDVLSARLHASTWTLTCATAAGVALASWSWQFTSPQDTRDFIL